MPSKHWLSLFRGPRIAEISDVGEGATVVSVVDPSTFPGNRKAYAVDKRPRATGGYAEIFEATVKATGERVAFKRLRDTMPESTGRFRREIRIQCELDGYPHVMQVLDVDPGGRWYVMPLAEGDAVDLANELKDEHALVALILHAIDGLRAGHDLGYVHRDVTPHNLLAFGEPADRRWVVGDWGLVRQPHGQTTRKFTKTGVPIGTEGFIAPELLRDAHREASPAADVFSLGRLVAWALTGHWPLAGERLAPPGPFRRLVQRATANDPALRPSFDELLELVAAVTFTPAPDPAERAKQLEQGINDGDEIAADDLLELALDNPQEHPIFFDSLPSVRGERLRLFVQSRPDEAEQLVAAMRDHLLDTDGDRHFNNVNEPLMWLQLVASNAIAVNELGLAEDSAEALFEAEARWDRFDQRRRTRNFLERVHDDEAARAIARALQRVPQAVDWYLREDWRPSERTHRAIRAVLSAEAQPR